MKRLLVVGLSLLAMPACKRGQTRPADAPIAAHLSAESEPPAAPPAKPEPRFGPLAEAEQLVLVTSTGWNQAEGLLELHERDAIGRWQRIDVWPVALGHAGMAWGIGLHGNGKPANLVGPQKVEGDGRTPAGVFRIVAGYGTGPANTKMPYKTVGKTWLCVDDPSSEHYNQVFDAKKIKHDWASAEVMNRSDGKYEFVLEVAHNDANEPKKGSCIFLHVAGADFGPTIGCTAMTREKMQSLLSWLDPAKHPILVALPDSARAQATADWQLP